MVSEAAFLDPSEEAIPMMSDHILTPLYSGVEESGLCQLEKYNLSSVFAHVYFVLFLHINKQYFLVIVEFFDRTRTRGYSCLNHSSSCC